MTWEEIAFATLVLTLGLVYLLLNRLRVEATWRFVMELGPLGPADPYTGADPCPTRHAGAEPVDVAITGERVAWWCPDCEHQLPAAWRPEVVDLFHDPKLLNGAVSINERRRRRTLPDAR